MIKLSRKQNPQQIIVTTLRMGSDNDVDGITVYRHIHGENWRGIVVNREVTERLYNAIRWYDFVLVSEKNPKGITIDDAIVYETRYGYRDICRWFDTKWDSLLSEQAEQMERER